MRTPPPVAGRRAPTTGAPPATAPRRRRGWIPRRARRGPARPGRRAQRSQRGAAHRASARPGPAPTPRAPRGCREPLPGPRLSRGPRVSRSSRARWSGSTSRPSGAETRRARSTASAGYAGGPGSARRTPTRAGRCSAPITICTRSRPTRCAQVRAKATRSARGGTRSWPANPPSQSGHGRAALGEGPRGPGVDEHGAEVGAEHQDRRPTATGRAAAAAQLGAGRVGQPRVADQAVGAAPGPRSRPPDPVAGGPAADQVLGDQAGRDPDELGVRQRGRVDGPRSEPGRLGRADELEVGPAAPGRAGRRAPARRDRGRADRRR